jgi:hypothetical protein
MKLFRVDAMQGKAIGQQFAVAAPDPETAVRLITDYKPDRPYTSFRVSGVKPGEEEGPARVIGPSGSSEHLSWEEFGTPA